MTMSEIRELAALTFFVVFAVSPLILVALGIMFFK